MNKKSKLVLYSAISLLSTLFSTQKSQAQITVLPNQTAQALVDRLVGPGVTTSNATLNCNGNANGYFSGTSNLGLDSGIVLGTGYANTTGGNVGLNGAATLDVANGGNVSSDADLVTMAAFYSTGSSDINNACVLEFDFIPKGDTVKFDYVFGSEEYNTYACSQWTDMFALFVSGPGIVPNGPFVGKKNVALVPGTNTPVMINTINAGNSISSECTDIDPNAPYTQYFVNNINQGGSTVAYNGFTTVLTAVAAVIPCETYHLKFAVGNVGDNSYQSAVMLKAGSLTSTAVATTPSSGLGANTNKLHTVRGCTPAEIKYKRADCDTMSPFTFHLEIGGTAIPGVHYEPIANTLPIAGGTSTGTIVVKGLLGSYSGETYVVIGVKHPDSILVGASIVPIIKRDTVYIYDSLYVNISTPPITVCPNTAITIQGHTDPSNHFSWTPVEFNNNSLTINPTMLTSRMFTLKVTQPGAPSTCPPAYRHYLATVEQYPIITVSSDTTICLADSVPIPVMASPDSVNYLYNWSPSTGLRAANLGTNYFYGYPGIYHYELTVTTPEAGCSSSKNIKITAVLPEKFTSVSPASGQEFEYNKDIPFSAHGNFIYYRWEPSELFLDPYLQFNTAKALETRTYQAIGIDKYGCRDTADILINVKFPPDPIMPNAFSPNGDGKNDYFMPKGNKFSKVIRFQVYNRWGQEVFSTNDPLKGWDGSFKDKPAEQGTYMYIFIAELPNKEQVTYKGDVTLIR